MFDTGPLRHFAAAGWLGPLRYLIGPNVPALVPRSVEREIYEAADYEPALRSLLDDGWLRVFRDEGLDYLAAYAAYENLLVEGRANRGECGVLAMGETFGCTVVLDDETPRLLAEKEGLTVVSTVQLLVNAVRERRLPFAAVEALADDLLATEYYLPFKPGEFRAHVLENGLIDYELLEPPRPLSRKGHPAD